MISSRSEIEHAFITDLCMLGRRSDEERMSLPRSQSLPSLRSEFLRIFTVEVFSSMHDVDLVIDLCSFLDEDRRFLIRSSTNWKCGIGDAGSAVRWDDRMESQN